ncbi:MAG: hypothetical protein NTX13_00050 [Acidobacteria bacterium]|nr:hypothetical protein [Acidobacteriota bacterium]
MAAGEQLFGRKRAAGSGRQRHRNERVPLRRGDWPGLDRAALGGLLSEFSITLASGSGLANARVTANFIGAGKVVRPSTITIPSAVSEEFRNSASAAITISIVNSMTNRNFVMLDQTWNNSVREQTGFCPGSGSDTDAAIHDQMEFGDREPGFKLPARFDIGSTELTGPLRADRGRGHLVAPGRADLLRPVTAAWSPGTGCALPTQSSTRPTGS